MFTIETFTEAHLSSVTNRTEAHGDDRVPAVSISLEMTCANTMLDAIDATLRDALYKAVEGQDQLPGVEPATPVLRSNSVDLVTLPTKHEGWRLTIDDGIDDTDPMRFAGVKVDKLSVEPKQGGSVVLRFRCGTADVDAERPRRTEMEAQTDAGASPVQREVRPTAWYDSESGTTDHGPWKPMRKPSNQGAEWLPLYDQAALDAAVAAERERCASIANEQTLAWGEGAGPWNDACLLIVKLIRET